MFSIFSDCCVAVIPGDTTVVVVVQAWDVRAYEVLSAVYDRILVV